MITRALLTHTVCFLIGIAGTAIVLKPSGNAGIEEAENPRSTPATRRARPERDTRPHASRELLRQAPDSQRQSDREKWIADLPTSEIPGLLDAACENVPPGGLGYETIGLIRALFTKWLKENPDECVGWTSRLPTGPTKRYFLDLLCREMMKQAPDQALALSIEYQAEDPEWNHTNINDLHVYSKIESAWKKPHFTAREMSDLFSSLSRGNGSLGFRLGAFPADFDFKTLMDALYPADKKDNLHPYAVPMDALKSWALHDPSAAAEWMLDNSGRGQQPLMIGWNDIATAVSSTHGPTGYHQWVADLLAGADEKQFATLAGWIGSAEVIGVAEKMSDTAMRDRMLTRVARNISGQQLETAPLVTLCAEISTPEARLAMIRDQASYAFRTWLNDKRLTAADWQKLGLTEAQVRAAVDP